MSNKIISLLKTALMISLGIIIPLMACIIFTKSSFESDVFKCVDTFIENENVNISKCLQMEFDNTYHDIQTIKTYIENNKIEDIKDFAIKYVQQYPTTNYINVYDETGKLLVSSSKSTNDVQLEKSSLSVKDGIINYSIVENTPQNIAIEFLCSCKNATTKKNNFVKLSVNWKLYEKYINKINEGSFSRMFYIISPECKRYVSFNALPERPNKSNAIALGMHLTEKISSIINGLTSLTIASINFRIMKSEIRMPDNMSGTKFFFVTATDNSALQSVSKALTGSLPFKLYLMLVIILLISVTISKKYTQANEALALSNKISESTPLAIVIFDASSGFIKKINLAACTLLQIKKDEVEKVNMWNTFVSATDREYIKNAIESDMAVFNYEVLSQTFSSGTFWSVCSASPVVIEGVKYIVLGILDVNRRKEIEKKLANNAEMLEKQVAERTADLEKNATELQEMNEKLEQAKIKADTANNAKSTFLTNVSNELKTPLNAIIGYSEILKEEAEDRKDNVTADDLTKIIGSAHHLLSLINEILDLSQIESGKIQLFFENLPINSMLKEVESVIMPTITNNNNSLYIEASKDVGIMYTDATKLRQCLLNLLTYSAKNTEFGKITLHTGVTIRDGVDFIEFSIIDTGRGIAPDELEKIFDPFDDDGSDINLTLPITKEYIGYLGGTVDVESELGVGTKFIVKLPRVCETKSSNKIIIKNEEQKQEEELEELKDWNDINQ